MSLTSRKMECIVIVGIMKNATMKGLIAFDFGSFVKSKDLTPYPLLFLYLTGQKGNSYQTGDILTTEASELSRGNKTSAYLISVKNDKGELIASSQALAYIKQPEKIK
jgi:hypothetical protein